MLHKVKSGLGMVQACPQTVRVVLILASLLVAALVGGAPHDFGGSGGG